MVFNQKLMFCPKNRFILPVSAVRASRHSTKKMSHSSSKNANFLYLHIVSVRNMLIISRESKLELFANAHKID